MKKLISLALAVLMLLSLSSVAFAADMGVQVIGGPEEETEPVNLDDLKLNVEAEIDGWGILNATDFSFADSISIYYKNDYWNTNTVNSGEEADYALLKIDITNTTLKAKDYLTDVAVKVVFDDTYEYAGWFYQFDYNRSNGNERARRDPINSEDQFAIEPMYQGHYLFGCTLPNAVVNGKKPLQMIITIDGNEITYNIRK